MEGDKTHDIVVGVDTSGTSRHAVTLACDMVRSGPFGRPLLVHVIPWSPYSFTTPEDNERRPARKQAEIEAARTQIIEPLTALAAECGVEVDSRIEHGDRVDVLLRIADEQGTRQS